MFALIKREIEDVIIFFLITAIFIAILVSALIYRVSWEGGSKEVFGVPPIMYKILFSFPFSFLPFIAVVFGALQMSLDKNRKISSFLVTLATTRGRILTAKITAGILWILLVILPVAAADIVLLRLFPGAALPDCGFLIRMFVITFLCSLACYSFGLQIGWHSGKLLPALGVISIMPLLVGLIIIKGIGFQTMALLILFTVAAMVRTWQKFMSTPL